MVRVAKTRDLDESEEVRLQVQGNVLASSGDREGKHEGDDVGRGEAILAGEVVGPRGTWTNVRR